MRNKNCLSSQNLCLEVAKVWGKSLGRRFYAKALATEAEGYKASAFGRRTEASVHPCSKQIITILGLK